MLAFWLADRWGEPDPLKILSLPASVLMLWLAFFNHLNGEGAAGWPFVMPESAVPDDTDAACAAFMRVMK